MAEKRNFTALDWVTGEIAETLKQASDALEAYVSNSEDATRIRFCLNYIHQVCNILQMVELHGGALLAEEMEKLAQALIDKSVASTTEAHEVLMRAILQLPVYLDRVKAARSDDPASLMGLLNDLRAVRGEHLFTETQLFAPDMRAAHQVQGARVRFDAAQFADIMAKLGRMYETTMQALMRDKDFDNTLPALKKIFENFRKVCQGTARAPLWDVCLAVLEGIENDTIPGSVAINNLLRQLDGEIRAMAAKGVASLDMATPDELLKNLLYYIARSQAESPLIAVMREQYKLDRALPGMQAGGDEATLGAPDPEAMRSVVIALCNEFVRAKEIFDQYVNGQAESNAALGDAVAIFKQAADTLAVLGLGDMRRKLEHISQDLRAQMATSTLATADTLMDAAASLIEIETGLNEKYNRDTTQADDGSPRSMTHAMMTAQETVLLECHNGLEQAKDAIVEYIGSQWDITHLQSLPDLLQGVRGGLEIISQRRAARVLGACGRYIREQLIEAHVKPDFRTMDTLADAIASVEYYLECLDEDVIEDQDNTLAVAESSVAALGYAVAVHHRAQPAQVELGAELDAEQLIDEADQSAGGFTAAEENFSLAEEEAISAVAESVLESVPATAVVDELQQDEGLLLQDSLPEELVVQLDEEALPEEIAAQADEEMLPEDMDAQLVEYVDEEAQHEEPVALQVVPAGAAVAAVAEHGKPEFCDDDLVVADFDDEIAEIFIEEAQEVMEAINEFYPQWRENFDNKSALTEFRRGFHTLKGSGRMAKALELGELAWSIESMLNRIIDGSIEASADVCMVIDAVVAKIPSMIDAFAARKVDPQPALTQRLHDAASSLASGGPLLSFAAPVQGEQGVVVPIESTEGMAFAAELLAVDEFASIEDVVPEEGAAFTEEVELADIPVLAEMAESEDMDEDFDATLWEIFASEAEMHLVVVDEWMAYARERSPLPVETTDPLQRALHTLKGSAHMAEVTPIAELATPLEKFVKELRAYQIKVSDAFTDLLAEVVDEIRYGIRLIESHKRVVLPRTQDLLARTASLRLQLTGGGEAEAMTKVEAPVLATVDPARFNRFLVEGMDALMDVTPHLQAWIENGDGSGLDRIVAELQEMSGGAEEAGLAPIASLAATIAPCYAHARQTHSGFAAWLPLAEEAHNALIDFMDRLAASEELAVNEAMESQLHTFCDSEFVDEMPAVAAEAMLPVVDLALEEVAASEWESTVVTEASELTEVEAAEVELIEFPEDLQAVAHAVSDSEAVLSVVTAEPEMVAEDVEAGGTIAPAVGGILEYSADIETELLDIFLEEADELVEELEQLVADWQGEPDDNNFADALRRNLHTLKGGARMAGLTGLGSLAHDLETQLEHFAGPADTALFDSILQYQDAIFGGIEQGRALAAGEEPQPLRVAIPGAVEPAGAEELPVDEKLLVDVVSQAVESVATSEAVEETFADMAVLEAAALGEEWLEEEILEEEVVAAPFVEPTIAEEEAVAEPAAEDRVVEELIVEELVVEEPCIEEPVLAEEIVELAEEMAPAVVAEPEIETAAVTAPAVDLGLGDDVEPELLEIFLDEAGELLEELDAQIHGWRDAPDDRGFCDGLKRTLHTFKGGARMAGVMGLGELAHDLESQLEFFSGTADEVLFDTLHSYQDKLIAGIAMVQRVVAGESVAAVVATAAAPVPAITPVSVTAPVAEPVRETVPGMFASPADVAEVAATAATAATEEMTEEDVAAQPSATIIPFRGGQLPRGLEEAIAGKKGALAAAEAKAAQAQQEMIKVSSDLLENLVNLAGETSINRSRVEQQMIDIERSADDMDGTIKRLQDQLRRLEIETDAQIQSRLSEIQERSDDFDPLEMDRYSTLQQLTRSLSESASDLIEIRNTLNNKLRDTETLLVQQARINTGLQEGLMRSRMVPFSRLEPRLRRIVRQVASELKKDIAFDLENVQGELDRTMLERMVAPLEHMLRNACDHGVETPEKRLAAGKPKQGRVVLSMGRDGGDVLISLRDDGGGINVDAVRKKAIERGLLAPNAPITDNEALQFILQAGFSTAEKVTQISGRGVGMDVVHSEIKAMGGSMTIHSAVGKGTEFIVRLPFTVSVNRALMVRIGEEMYAIPLTSIEGIVRVSPYELESYYEDPEARFEYAARHYEVKYLGTLLHTKPRAMLDNAVLPEPVLLVRSNEHTVAIHVDQLVGSREIVVKALGPQFAAVPGLSGATLLGDGSVVVILDLLALVRASIAHEGVMELLDSQGAQAQATEETITVMVCDDSVTVRKVTSRLLEREGFDVMLAKDGADALLQMQDRLPDVLLLDIEMPRMDGFEVASTMKNSQRLQDIPIVMITSRTGEKHRERAMGMGVERYMGKPYVEEELMMTINDLVGERLARRMARYERGQG